MTITEFLTARYDDDEAVARNAPDGPWEHGYVEDLEPNAHFVFGRPVDPVSPYSGRMIAGGYEDAFEPIADYIAYFDPESMLADIAAKRAIVENMAGVRMDQPAIRIYREGLAEATLRMLAQPYADHPDFDPAWTLTN